MKLHYEQSGDNYKIKDPFKITALKVAKSTFKNLRRFSKYGLNIEEIKQSRGESAYRVSIQVSKKTSFELAHVEEGIGTKNVIADELYPELGPRVFEFSAIDNAASIFNDLSTTGAFPLTFMLHVAAYPTEWFTDSKRANAIIEGTLKACNLAGAAWGGGESPTMRDIIKTHKSLLSGSATGIIVPISKALSEEKIEAGDRIILLSSSGVHTNGITLLRKELLKRLPKGYKTKLSDGQTYGEALLTPTIIYSSLVEEILQLTDLHYAVHITGHGWRKIMRSSRNFTYTINKVPTPQPVFELIKEYTKSDEVDMYDTYNMGAGFALFAPLDSVKTIINISKKHKIEALDAGIVTKGQRQVIIEPKGVTFKGGSLQVR